MAALIEVLREVREVIGNCCSEGASVQRAAQLIDQALARHEVSESYPFWHVTIPIKASATIEVQADTAARAKEKALDIVSLADAQEWEAVVDGVDVYCLGGAEDE